VTKDKDEKAVIRARMARTGESYAAARAQLAKGKQEPVAEPRTAPFSFAGFSEQAMQAAREARGPNATAWDLVLALRGTTGVAGRVLTELGFPVARERPANVIADPTVASFDFTDSWLQAIKAASKLARAESRDVIDSSVLLRGAVSALTPDVIPAAQAEIAQRLWADLVTRCAEAESKVGAENAPRQSRTRERTGMFERFTDKARLAVTFAQEEARDLDHHWIGTEHLLLGLLREGTGVGAQALASLGIELEQLRREVLVIIGTGAEQPTGHIPFTPRAKKVMEMALREALALQHNYIGTEHILLGLVREGEGVAAQILNAAGATADVVRATVIELLAKLTAPDED